jgi:peptidoglycan biosynthesis protein MviN/MurJ (putative lipid II flippase)
MHRKTEPNKLLLALARRLAKAAEGNYQPKSIFRRTIGALLELFAFALLTYGGWQINSTTGTFIAAFSCLVLAWHVNTGGSSPPDPSVR